MSSTSKNIVRAFEKDLNDGMNHNELLRKWGEPFIEAWKLHEEEKRKIVSGRKRKLSEKCVALSHELEYARFRNRLLGEV